MSNAWRHNKGHKSMKLALLAYYQFIKGLEEISDFMKTSA